MKKFSILLFSSCLLGFSFYGLSSNSYYVQILMNTSVLFIYARLALVAVLLLYVFVPSLRLYTARAMLRLGGIFLLSLGLMSIGSPSLLGHAPTYVLLGDSLTLIEGGILSIVLSVELSAQRSRFISRSFGYVLSLFTTPRKKLAYAQSTNRASRYPTLARPLLNVNENLAVPMYKQLVRGYAIPRNTPV